MGQWRHVILLLKRLGIILGLFSLCRILFFLFNYHLFPDITFWRFLKIMFYGLRFDLSAIVYINSLFILLHLLPGPWRPKPWFQTTLKVLFYSVNGIALFFEAGDFIYYAYAQQRTSSHILGLINDIPGLIPQFLKDFWYVLLIIIGLVLVVERLYRKAATTTVQEPDKIKYPLQGLIFLVGMGLVLVAGRGGFQLKPLSPITAARYVRVNEVSLVTNTTFTVLYSLFHRELEDPAYMPPEKARALFNIRHRGGRPEALSLIDSMRPHGKPNVVVFIMESFSKEYIGYYNGGDGFTPFLDSLMGHSLVFTDAYANGKHSIDAVPAITAGLPALMNDAYISSMYATNRLNGLGTLLRPLGYRTYFLHGGNNGTMNFDQYIAAAGFDKYIGRNEYGKDSDFDGNWGIFDLPFFDFTARTLDTVNKPFCAVVFSLSSHHPFTLPPGHQNRYRKGPLPILETVGYSDNALRHFFNVAKAMPWFDNTLFIITADHTGPILRDVNKNRVGEYRIPIIAYLPGRNLHREINYTVQQVDIFNTILEYCGFRKEYVSFGNSLMDTTAWHFSANAMDNIYQILHQGYVLQFNGTKVIGYYHYAEEPGLKKNLAAEHPAGMKELETKLKAIIQIFNNVLIHNTFYVE